jgi:hypothetical protein
MLGKLSRARYHFARSESMQPQDSAARLSAPEVSVRRWHGLSVPVTLPPAVMLPEDGTIVPSYGNIRPELDMTTTKKPA